MRWYKEKVKLGDERVVMKFLWFPLTIDKETRWLEHACIKQCVEPAYQPTEVLKWQPIKFACNGYLSHVDIPGAVCTGIVPDGPERPV